MTNSSERLVHRPVAGVKGKSGAESVRGYADPLAASPTGMRAPTGVFYRTGPVLTLGPTVQSSLEVSTSADPFEREAEHVASQVMVGTFGRTGSTRGSLPAKLSPMPSGVVARDEKTAAEPAKPEEKATETGFGSPAAPWFVLRPLILKFPSRWKAAANKSAGELSLDDQKLYADFTGALQNLLYAGMLTQMSSYKPDFSKGLEAAESLSGVTDTYLKLVSFAFQKDIEKYLGEEAKPIIMQNLGWMVIYGLFLQGGLVGLNAAVEKDLNFTTILGPAVKSFTEAPQGFARPMLRPNVLDPRWGSYPFFTAPSGLEAGVSGREDAAKPYTFNLKLGVNVASLADLYPEKDEDKKKYKGFELYPYLSFTHSWEKEGAKPPDFRNIWLAGMFFGGDGVYTIVEGGQKDKADDTIAETYLRTGLVFRNLGALQLGQLTSEYSLRPSGDLRTRLNAASSIKLIDTKSWQATLGAGIGGLLPSATRPGALDFSGEASLTHKSYQEGVKAPFNTGLSLGSTWRNQDPFDPTSGRMFSVGGKLTILDMLILSAEHHQISDAGAVPGLPGEDTRFMLSLGSGIFRRK